MQIARKLIFLFGAGASHGAGDVVPGNPPLGAQLYPQLAEHFKGSWGCLPADAHEAFTAGNFETGMAVIYNRYSTAVPVLMQELAVYLVQYRPYSGNTLYCHLINTLRDTELFSNTIFSTLNYDCLLEFSLLRQGLLPSYFENASDIPVWKLHGSCNWFSHEVKATSGVQYTKDVVWEGGVEAFFDIGEVVRNCLVNQGLAPVMALYMIGKPLQVSPSALHDIQTNWQQAVFLAQTVVCVGVRPWPADTHIWGPLAQTDANLLYIGNREEFDAWVTAYRQKPSTYLAPYFNEGFAALVGRLKNETNRS